MPRGKQRSQMFDDNDDDEGNSVPKDILSKLETKIILVIFPPLNLYEEIMTG